MRKCVSSAAAVACVLGLCAASAEAQLKAGTYQVAKATDGKTKRPYRGLVTVIKTGKAYSFHRWTSRGVKTGVGVVHGNKAWVGAGPSAAAVFATRSKSGKVRGHFTLTSHPRRIGTFTGRVNPGGGFRGTVRIRGVQPSGKRFTGTLLYEPGDMYNRVVLSIGRSRPWEGVGAATGTTMGAALGPDAWSYTVKRGKLVGWRASNENPDSNDTETLRFARVATVAQLRALKNATCSCPGNRCAQFALREFGRFYNAFKTQRVNNATYAQIKNLSAETTKCLMKRGIPGKRVLALVGGGGGGGTASSQGGSVAQIEALARDTCQCPSRVCGEAHLTQFAKFIRANKSKRLAKADSKRVSKASSRITQCLMKLGFTGAEVMQVVQKALK